MLVSFFLFFFWTLDYISNFSWERFYFLFYIKSLYYKITNGIYTIPSFISPEAQDLIRNLLNINVDKRFNIKNIRSHPWFNIESEQIEEKCIIPDLESIQVDDEIVDIMIDNFFNDGSKVPSKNFFKNSIKL